MLQHLHITNIVLIKQLSLDVAGGLTALTGETGAGKSIILDALGLALGARADAKLIRHGEDTAQVTATFDNLSKNLVPQINALADEFGLQWQQPLLLRRVLTQTGTSRAFVNDTPVSVQCLQRLGSLLLEIHGQFDNQALFETKTQRLLLDRFAESLPLAENVKQAWGTYQQAVQHVAQIKAAAEKAARDEDYLRHVVKELQELNVQPDEEQQLAAQRQTMMHAEKVLSTLHDVATNLTADKQGVLSKLNQSLTWLERLHEKADNAHIDSVVEPLNNAVQQLSLAEGALQDWQRSLQFDGGTQSDVDERLFALRAAARKHNTQVVELPNLLLQITAQLELIDTSQADLLAAEKACAQAWQHYETLAQQLFAMRQKAALVLAKAVQAELPALKMDKAQFVVDVQMLPQGQWGADGCDTVQFLVATNQGTQAAPLAKIASGGEMARFMLALKLVCRAVEPVPSLIFDEVDTGIGGAVAAAVGQRLQTLGQSAQVFVVTHAPQVAAYAHQHWVVAKATQNAKVTTSVRPLDTTERVQELARMLSGSDVTTAATLAAQSLLDDAHSEKTKKKKTA